MAKRTFYDQWYRIGGLRLGLRGSVLIRRQEYRGEPWYVYYDPAHNGFFRARPDTHEIIKRLTPDRSLADIWRDLVQSLPEKAPGQEDFFELVASLYRGNLLYVEGTVSETRLLDRALTKKKKPFAQRMSQLLFFRVPLWDPEPLLARGARVIDRIYSWPMVALVAVTCVVAAYMLLLNADRALAQTGDILQAGNLPLLFAATFLTHALHEMSHAALCKHYGGHVRTMGVMFLIFTPLPYADVSASWGFRSAWHRAAVGAAGMYADLFVCSLAVIYWAVSPPGLGNEMALNLMFVTAFYTFVFNANPLMRFDGYYILSDLVAIPNLHQVSKSQFNAVFKRLALSEPIPPKEKVSRRRRLFLVGFFLTSFIYRNIVMIGIVVFVADQYLGLGLIGAAAIAYNSFLAPLGKLLKPLWNKHFMSKHRGRVRLMLAGVALVIGAVALMPVPEMRRLQGVVEARDKTAIFAPVEGEIAAMPDRSGLVLTGGEALLRMVNPELGDQRRELLAQIKANMAREVQARVQGGAELASVQQERAALDSRLAEADDRIARLSMAVPHGGTWVLGDDRLQPGAWVTRGQMLGQVVNQDHLVFKGILAQEAAYGIATLDAQDLSVRVEGLLAQAWTIADLQIVPYSQRDLPSAALSPLGGGGTSIEAEDPNALQAVERFFLISADLVAPNAQPAMDGRTGWMRMVLPPRPLLAQGWDRLRQFVQRRYTL